MAVLPAKEAQIHRIVNVETKKMKQDIEDLKRQLNILRDGLNALIKYGDVCI